MYTRRYCYLPVKVISASNAPLGWSCRAMKLLAIGIGGKCCAFFDDTAYGDCGGVHTFASKLLVQALGKCSQACFAH
jgi:hypothetical protein